MLFGSRISPVLFFVLCFVFPFVGRAGSDEVLLSTPDGRCVLRYLTTYPKDNWNIQVDQKNCSEGFVQGYTQVHIYDNHHQLSEKLTGFFADGYWLGSFMGQGPVLNRTTPEAHQQALTLKLGKDELGTYIVQLRSVQEEDRSYGPFMGCPDFRMMVVVSDDSIFDELEFQEKIAHKATQYAESLCGELDTIAVFGSTQMAPQNSDIVFQMLINPETQERQIVPLTEIVDTTITTPIELRSQKGEVLFKVEAPDLNKISRPLSEKILKRTALAHLDILSRINQKPVKGKVVVHVQQLNLDGSALVDLPQPVLLQNLSDLKTGWQEVSGLYYQGKMSVSSVQPCTRKWCSDVS